jgi:hypothetical protein
MATISSVSSSLILASPVRKVQEQSTAPAATDPSIQAAAVAAGGSLPSMQPPVISPPLWKTRSSDPITSLMTINYGSPSIFSRFDGLGAAALQRLGTDPGNFSQSVSRSGSGAQTAYRISLNITLADSVTVKVSLESTGDSLALEIKSSGKLSVSERNALSKLADGFQNAIDGMTDSSKLDFSGLLQYDHSLLSSIDLQATVQNGSVAVQTQSFHADDKTRSFSSDGPDGKVNIAVDLRQLAAIGNAQQRKAGMDAYLKQFDEAGVHGHANAGTLATFKAAFKQMIGAGTTATAFSTRPVNLSDTDHAILTGLPDFSASMTDTPVASNPMRQNEVDTFAYQVSQDTGINDYGHGNRSISQKQHAHLEASFHEPLSADASLALDNSKQSQNYYFQHVSEDSISDTEISYNNGMLAHASTTQSSTGTMLVLKYVMGMLTEETRTPFANNTKKEYK